MGGDTPRAGGRARASRPRTATSRAMVEGGTLPRGPLLPAERLRHRASRRCASGRRTSRCSPSTSWRASPRRMNRKADARLRRRRWRPCSAYPGRGTCASCRTPWSARSWWAADLAWSPGPAAAHHEAPPGWRRARLRRRRGPRPVRARLERWNISRAARVLDVDRVTLYNKIRKYGSRNPPMGASEGPPRVEAVRLLPLGRLSAGIGGGARRPAEPPATGRAAWSGVTAGYGAASGARTGTRSMRTRCLPGWSAARRTRTPSSWG